MATLIQAVAKYRPHIVHRGTIGFDTIAERMCRGSLVSPPILRMVLHELQEALVDALLRGETVKVPGIGRFEVTCAMDGSLRVKVNADPAMSRRLSEPGAFRGQIAQRDHVGLERDALVAKWNTEHPDDPIAVPDDGQQAA